jgi:hypothetical protein
LAATKPKAQGKLRRPANGTTRQRLRNADKRIYRNESLRIYYAITQFGKRQDKQSMKRTPRSRYCTASFTGKNGMLTSRRSAAVVLIAQASSCQPLFCSPRRIAGGQQCPAGCRPQFHYAGAAAPGHSGEGAGVIQHSPQLKTPVLSGSIYNRGKFRFAPAPTGEPRRTGRQIGGG